MSRDVSAIQRELFEMPEWKRLARVQQLNASIRLLERNGSELEQLVRFLVEDRRSLPLSDVNKRAALDTVFEEVLRLLHNFVAAALSLVDHTRIVYRELYESAGQFPEYQDEVKRRFVDVPLLQFVQGLRHFAQHYRIPELSYVMNWNRDKGMVRRLVLLKSDLLEFGGWKAVAREHLEAGDEQIDILELVLGYSVAIRRFYTWMAERQAEIHASDEAAVDAKQAEAHRAMAPDVPYLVSSGLDLADLGIGSVRDAFAFGLSPSDHAGLSEHENDLPRWTELAVGLVEKKFGPLPKDLLDRVRAIAERLPTTPSPP